VCAFSSPAFVEHKLFPTDVLDTRQFEAEADFAYAYRSYNYTVNYLPAPVRGTTIHETFASSYSLGVGLGYGIQLNASLPYYFENETKSNNPANSRPLYLDHRGVGDFVTGLKYSLYSGKQTPITVVTGLDVKFQTADSNKAGTGTTDVRPYLIGSYDINRKTRTYAEYSATLRNNGAADAHTLSAGVQYEINPIVTVTPHLHASFQTSTDIFTANESYGIGVSSYLQVFRNLYLIPSVAYTYYTPITRKIRSVDFDEANSVSGGLGLYYYFN
jgi:hypothetical protein